MMASVTFTFCRTYTITEGFERTYTAATLEQAQAQAMADDEAMAANQDCPDDCAEIEGGFTEASEFIAKLA